MSELNRAEPLTFTANSPQELAMLLRESSEVNVDNIISFRAKSMLIGPLPKDKDGETQHLIADESGHLIKGRYIGTTSIGARPEYPEHGHVMAIFMDGVSTLDEAGTETILTERIDFRFDKNSLNFEATSENSRTLLVVVDDLLPNAEGLFEAKVVGDVFYQPEELAKEIEEMDEAIDDSTIDSSRREIIKDLREIRLENAAYFAAKYLPEFRQMAMADAKVENVIIIDSEEILPTTAELAEALKNSVPEQDLHDLEGMEMDEALGYAFTLLLENGIENPETYLIEKGILE